MTVKDVLFLEADLKHEDPLTLGSLNELSLRNRSAWIHLPQSPPSGSKTKFKKNETNKRFGVQMWVNPRPAVLLLAPSVARESEGGEPQQEL